MKLNVKLSQLHLLLGAAFFSIFLLSNCEEKPLEAGLNIIESEFLEVHTDTIPVELFTISDESLITQSIGISPLGVVYDTVIGILETEFLADFIYQDEVSFLKKEPDSVTFIDLKIYLDFPASYGDSMDIDFDVYELTYDIPKHQGSNYVMFDHMYDHQALNIGSPQKLSDDTSVYVVELSEEFGNKLIEANQIDTMMYVEEHVTQFKNYFKGLYFATEPRATEGGGIILVDQTKSRMVLRTEQYNEDSGKNIIVSDVFEIGNPKSEIDSVGIHLNLYNIGYADQVADILDNTDDINKRAYVSALAGPQVLVKMPALEQMREEYEGEISVNYAKLIIPVNEEVYFRDSGRYAIPAQLGIYDSELKTPILDDQLALNHLGGKLDTADYCYRFNIGNHVHDYLRSTGSIYNNSFNLFIGKGSPVSRFLYTPSRVVLQQDSSVNRVPMVKIVYSVIPK
jgi:hypothetical protein